MDKDGLSDPRVLDKVAECEGSVFVTLNEKVSVLESCDDVR